MSKSKGGRSAGQPKGQGGAAAGAPVPASPRPDSPRAGRPSPGPGHVLDLIRKNGVKIVDMRFCDFFGAWQHFSVPAHTIGAGTFEEGLGFDGSSIRGWKSIHESDMLVLPDPETAFMDPFSVHPTLVLVCSVKDPVTHEDYRRAPRNVASRAEDYIRSTGIADTAFFGPEVEFFVFDDVRYASDAHSAFYFLDSEEGAWNSGREEQPNLGYKIRHKEGYFPVAPADKLQDLRSEMLLTLEEIGVEMECQHHEVATAGQCEIDMRFDRLVRMADKVLMYKYVLRNVAARHGKTVTFMPKPLFGDNGTGMHCHFSLWKDAKPLFAGEEYGGMSEMALHAIGGVLKHARALNAFTNPTTNSYKRLVPGYEAPINLAYSGRNRSASVRIPMLSSSPKQKRFEIRFPDPSANPYFAFAALSMAAMDGILNKIDPGQPLDKDIYDLPPEELKRVPRASGSLEEALDALEKDHAFLLKGDVFNQDIIRTWIEIKRTREVDQLRIRPHPHEFQMYFDA
ncbi:MAG TPA: type I glutamate--ammonia ligase [Planctomycetota bacterium]|nr:type I glutamate--ammonia ligase [Planctomycetota bacterium]